MKTRQSGREVSLIEDIRKGKKTVEGRLCRSKFVKYKVGDRVNLRADVYDADGELIQEIPDQAMVEIASIQKLSDFDEFLRTVGYKKAIPRASSIEEALAVYRRFYTLDDERKYGVLAVHIKSIQQ